jgi:hypothetical protein
VRAHSNIRKSQKHYFNRPRLLRGGISSRFFINRAKYIDCDYCNINYKIRYYMFFKDTRRLAGNFKNSIFIFNRLINRENISLGFLTEIPEKFKIRFLNTESREILICSDNDRNFFFEDRLQSNSIDIGKDSSIITVSKSILFFSDIFNTSYFIKIDISNFLTNYRDMCEDYNIKKKRIYRYFRYYIKHIIIIIRGLASFIESD